MQAAAELRSPQAGLPWTNHAVAVCSHDGALHAIRDEWNELVDQVDPPSPFSSWEWLYGWWRHLAPQRRGGSSLHVIVFRNGGRVIGIAPLYRTHLGAGRLRMEMLLPLGWERGPAGGITEQMHLLFLTPERARCMALLCEHLAHDDAVLAVLPGMSATEPLPEWAERHAVGRGTPITYLHRSLPDVWDSLVRSLGKSMRDNVKYYPRLLLRHGHATVFDAASTPQEVSRALPTVFALHRARAEAPMRVPHRDYFASAARRRFLCDVAPQLAARGQLRIGVLSVEGTAVAAQMWAENRGAMFVYYSGYDPAWARYSVALVTLMECMRDAMSRGVRRLEFLGGTGAFKERWDPERRDLCNLTVARHPALLRPAFHLASARHAVRALL